MPEATVNLASKFSPKVDERFYRESQAAIALNNDYEFRGVKTVNVYSIPTAPLTNYARSGLARYGNPTDLTNTVQELTMTRDRAFTFIIDQGDKVQSQMVMDAGKALSREVREVITPEYDAYAFWKLARAAVANSATATTAPTTANAYGLFLNAQEALGDANVPDRGRVCFCSYKFANLLKQDPAFMKQSERAQKMLAKGVIGEVDGVKIVKVPKSHLPSGAAFLLTHPIAACGPKQLTEYKQHTNPPGISGWLVEGRILYDVFVLDQKKNAIFYHGTAPASTFEASATASGLISAGSGGG